MYRDKKEQDIILGYILCLSLLIHSRSIISFLLLLSYSFHISDGDMHIPTFISTVVITIAMMMNNNKLVGCVGLSTADVVLTMLVDAGIGTDALLLALGCQRLTILM